MKAIAGPADRPLEETGTTHIPTDRTPARVRRRVGRPQCRLETQTGIYDAGPTKTGTRPASAPPLGERDSRRSREAGLVPVDETGVADTEAGQSRLPSARSRSISVRRH